MKKLIVLFLLLPLLTVQAQQQYTIEKDINYYADNINKQDSYINSQCKLDFYYPKGAKNYATIIWFHGGSIKGGSKELPKALLDKGYAVIGVGYRLSPKVKAPAYIEDATAAIAWAFKHVADYGGSNQKIFVSGHSAGAYLAMMVALDKRYLQKYNIDANQIAGLIPISGQAITHFTIREERGIKELQPIVDEYAPLSFVRPDAPPMLLITGDAEMELFGRFEENAYLLRMMKLAGHTNTRLLQLQGYDHGGMVEPAFPLLLKEVKERSK